MKIQTLLLTCIEQIKYASCIIRRLTYSYIVIEIFEILILTVVWSAIYFQQSK